MTVVYSENFDSMAVGLDPPTGWVKMPSHEPSATSGVDNAHSASSPNSMYVKANKTSSSYWLGYEHDITYSSSEKIYAKVYMPRVQHSFLSFRSIAGGYDTGNVVNIMYFQSDGHLYVYNGSVLADTGYVYPIGAFIALSISFDFTAHTVDVWADGAKIASAYAFRNNESQIGEMLVEVNQTDGAYMWVDDIQFGESVTPSSSSSTPSWLPFWLRRA